ncbi:MAG: alpha/beta hydrolase [Phycisphaerales bacterium]|nr:alpha/beta hydrolase [Phycisphaerales bacterium]
MNSTTKAVVASAIVALAGLSVSTIAQTNEQENIESVESSKVRYGTETINELEIFYREAGTVGQPQLVLLHGFPTSSHMFRDLIEDLGDEFHIIAPDYPGYGMSSAPSTDDYEYSFENTADIVDELFERKGFDDYVLYVMDYGAPVGYRIATEHPERVAGFIVQNGNAYDEGLQDFWNPIKKYWESGSVEDRDALRGLLTLEATKWQYLTGVRDEAVISPDNWLVVQPLLDREGNDDVQLDMFYDYRTNVTLYPTWQKYFRDYQPPMLITWATGDYIFPESGAHPYLRDLPDAQLHLLETGHFALEEDGDEIAQLIRTFVKDLNNED